MAKAKERTQKPLIGILVGSDSDLPIMAETAKCLERFGIPYEIEVISAHRSPARTHEYASSAVKRGLKAIIVGAGGAAHLGGVVASLTTLPVIGVPLPSTALNGLDALLATVQMPAGIPVATMAIGNAGATNGAIFAAQILATSDCEIARRLTAFKKELAQSVSEKNARLQEKLREAL